MASKKYASLEERKDAKRRRRNQRRNGDDIERPRGRPPRYATVVEAKAAKIESQRLCRQRRKEEELREQQGCSDPASEKTVRRRQARKYATETEARAARNARRREIYQWNRVNATENTRNIAQESFQSGLDDKKDATRARAGDSAENRECTQESKSK